MLKGGSQGFGTDSSILLVFVQAARADQFQGNYILNSLPCFLPTLCELLPASPVFR